MQEVQMNLTKPLTIPYSDSKTPAVNNPTENVKRRICLCVTFNQLATSSVKYITLVKQALTFTYPSPKE